jgi:uncharacterized protein
MLRSRCSCTSYIYSKSLLHLLNQHASEAEVWAFGSRVSGVGHVCSDLDLVLRNPSDLKKPTEGSVDLKVAIEASNVPFLVDIHDWAHLPAHK